MVLEGRLLLHEAAVEAVLLHERFVPALLGDAPALQDVDAVRAADGREPVRDEDEGARLLQRVDAGPDLLLALPVHAAGRLVKDDVLGLAQQRAGDADLLPLPAGQLATAKEELQPMKDIRYWVSKVLMPEQSEVEKKPEPKHSVTEKIKFLQEQSSNQQEQKSRQHKKQNMEL